MVTGRASFGSLILSSLFSFLFLFYSYSYFSFFCLFSHLLVPGRGCWWPGGLVAVGRNVEK